MFSSQLFVVALGLGFEDEALVAAAFSCNFFDSSKSLKGFMIDSLPTDLDTTVRSIWVLTSLEIFFSFTTQGGKKKKKKSEIRVEVRVWDWEEKMWWWPLF